MRFAHIYDLAKRVKSNIQRVIVGKEDIIDLLLVALISSGHVLLEDVPGMGKTLLAKCLAKSLDCSFKRVQFTPDLLPSDLSGINYFNQKIGEFEFRPGPIFTNILLADEINRATPRTQSSLLECMEERQVTIDGETMKLQQPFMVIATQNPIEIQGTFPLPEAQLDRFLLKVQMGYPSTSEGIEILKRFKERNPFDEISPVVSQEEIIAAQRDYVNVFVSDDILRYIVNIVEMTRKHNDVHLGVSPRGSQALLRASQVYAILQGRDYVIPDDVKAMAKPVLRHRMILRNVMAAKGGQQDEIIDQILRQVPVPTEERLWEREG
ncbi:MoxR family ATPase [Caldicoprobacter algeriensis]|uniref:AAA family ATPase n=1 Tax=Caldicoprobacter algeriensis TaxID=699281 RepID=UPI00207A89AA|nr:MoxR family ATPase [Caldicoprobacter algeriensis]MCM8901673.1 MoxR family ATPase [Caldicoprobacter algeriensis]